MPRFILPSLTIWPNSKLWCHMSHGLRMKIPVTIRNLHKHQQNKPCHIKSYQLTAAGSSLASQDENGFSHHVNGIRMTPSIITCETCTPCGSNSRARACVSALSACLEMANGCIQAFAFTEPVAPVKISVGTRSGSVPLLLADRRRGSTAWAKRYAPILSQTSQQLGISL